MMSPQMKKMLVVTGIVFGIIFGWYSVKKVLMWYFMSHYQPPPVTVTASVATPKSWQSYLTSVGTLTSVNGVDLSSESNGIVKEIRFQSGQFVQQGDVLVLLDTRLEDAELKDNQSKLSLAQMNYDRNKTLAKKNVVSKAALDSSFAELQQAQAGVEATEAKIQLKTITAPFSGKIGIREINIGQFLSAGTAIASLQAMDPLYVRFDIPEQYAQNLYLQQVVDVTVNTSTGKKSIRGVVTAINSKVDQTTRNLLVQATIPNSDMQLFPGMFATIKIWLQQQNNVITVPETAISYSLHGDSVFVIKEDPKSKKKHPLLQAFREYVEVGEHRGNEVVIRKGLSANSEVVTSGQLKLQNGTNVLIDNSVGL